MEKKALIASTQLRLFLLKESDVTLIHITRVRDKFCSKERELV